MFNLTIFAAILGMYTKQPINHIAWISGASFLLEIWSL